MTRSADRQNRILTSDEERRLLNVAADHLRPALVAAIHTGMRMCELAALQWREVDLEQRVIILQDAKTAKERRIAITGPLSQLLTNLYRESPHGPRHRPLQRRHVFDLDDLRRAFSHACAKAGLLDVRFYDLRRTHIARFTQSHAAN